MAHDKKDGGMAMRGVSRPMAESENKKHHQTSRNGDGMDREMMLRMHHKQTLWVYWTIILLGVWMILSPLTFSYGKDIVAPAGDRSLWLSDGQRVLFMQWSDIISGILLLIFGWRSLIPNRPYSIWAACFVGAWLNIAPVLFWAPTAAAYMNSTFVGMLILSLTILIPGMPNMIMYMKMGSEVPQGWSYNPSSWPQRWIMIVTGFIGWCVSRYLAAYQMGYIDTIWDPFFGPQSAKVLTSEMSHSLFISDGALGALAYTFEFLMGYMGSPSRWRTMPWMVALFGILVIPLGLVHIFLVISQPVVVGAWCTFCLLAAAVMLPKVINAAFWGMSVPVGLAIATVLGLWLMFAPGAFGVSIEKTVADINHLGGALVVVTSVIAFGEVVRRARYFNILIALVVAIVPWFADIPSLWLNITSSAVAMLIIALSIPRGPKKENYGLWDGYV